MRRSLAQYPLYLVTVKLINKFRAFLDIRVEAAATTHRMECPDPVDLRIRRAMERLTNKQIRDQRDQYDRSYSSWTAKRKTPDDDPNDNNVIGVKAGESTFVIPEIRDDWREGNKRVPREDGTPWPPGEKGEGGYYEPEWKSEEERRREILEKNPDYKFLFLVAGATGLDVTVLYEEEDVAGIFRREQALLEEQRAGIRQTTLSIEQLDADVRSLKAELETLKGQREKMSNTRIESERLATELGEAEINYGDTEDLTSSLTRMITILGTYLAVPPGGTFQNETMIPTREQILSETRYQLGSPASQGLMEEGDRYVETMVRKGRTVKRDEFLVPGEGITTLTGQTFSEYGALRSLRDLTEADSEDLVQITRALVELYVIRRDYGEPYLAYASGGRDTGVFRAYAEELRTALSTTDLRQARDQIVIEKTQLLRAFYRVLFFMYVNEILSVPEVDLYEIVVGVGPPTVQRKSYEGREVEILYQKYGGKALILLPQEPAPDVRAFYTIRFNKILEEREPSTGKEPTIPGFRLYAFTFVKELRDFNDWLSKRIDKLDDGIREVEDELESSTRRLSALRRGEVTFRDIRPDYRHRRRWVELPEHSGIVRMKPIVVTAISQAFNWIKQFAPYGKRVDEEFMQRDPVINADFANMVALQMNYPLTIFPVTYRSPSVQDTVTLQKRNVGTRLQKNYRVRMDREGKYRAEFVRDRAGPTRSSLSRVFGGICYA